MAHFAKIAVGNIVEQVIVISNDVATTEQAGVDFINNMYNTRDVWKQTSYNTYGGKHLLGGTPLRGNYAGIGYQYDQTNDVFYAPQPYPSWTLDKTTWLWTSPVPYPTDGQSYKWDESTKNWILVTQSS
jgi:hypothetical protein